MATETCTPLSCRLHGWSGTASPLSDQWSRISFKIGRQPLRSSTTPRAPSISKGKAPCA